MHSVQRTALASLRYLLAHFPCVAVVGARQVGKTTLLRQLLPQQPFFDLERRADFERIQRDPDFFLSQFTEPLVIDEAQNLPELFPALRVAIDAKRSQKGRFLISGSSSPELSRRLHETLAGRMAVFELSGFSLEEAWQQPLSRFYHCVSKHDLDGLLSLPNRFSHRQLLETCLLGCFPEPWLEHKKDPKSRQLWMENYFRAYLLRDVRNLFPGLHIQTFQRFVAMLTGATGQILNYSEFARSLDVSVPTVKSYFQIAQGTFLWRLLPSFHKKVNKRVIKMPMGYMRDSGLANYFQHNYTLDILQQHPLVGKIWECFVIEELLKGFQNQLISAQPYYYRTSNMAEIDLLLEGEFGLLPIEIKLGTVTDTRRLRALQQFVEDHRLPLGLVLNNSMQPAWLTNKILQIPIGCL